MYPHKVKRIAQLTASRIGRVMAVCEFIVIDYNPAIDLPGYIITYRLSCSAYIHPTKMCLLPAVSDTRGRTRRLCVLYQRVRACFFNAWDTIFFCLDDTGYSDVSCQSLYLASTSSASTGFPSRCLNTNSPSADVDAQYIRRCG